MHAKYRLSGSIPFAGAGMMVCWVPLATSLMAILYAIAQYYCPWIYLCALITLCYGLATGWLAARLAKRGHVRNSGFTALVAFSSALFGYYIVWGTHLFLWEGAQLGSVFNAFRPDYIWEWVQIGYQKGFWGLEKGGNVTGWFLVLVWLIEFGFLVIAPPLVSAGVMMDSIYCETCSQWLNYETLGRSVAIDPTGGLNISLINGIWPPLHAAPDAPADGPHLRLLLAHCPHCTELAVLKVVEVLFQKNEKGELEEKKKTVIEQALMNPDDADLLKEFSAVEETPPT